MTIDGERDSVAASPDVKPGRHGSETRSYPLYVGGNDIEGIGWVHTVSSRSLLEDAFTSISLKRALDREADPEVARHPYVVGRCAVAGDAEIDLALEAASSAAASWAAVPLQRRMRLGAMFRDALVARREEFLQMMVAEGHPVKLAEWELSCLLQVYSPESCSWYAQNMWTESHSGARRMIVRRHADGVVCLNPPQNAPAPSAALAVLILMAGNAVVVRAPRSIALSTMYVLRELVAPLLDELDAPPGTLNAVCSNPGQTLRNWIASPLVDDIFYIGGVEEGLHIEQGCIASGKKPILELAGNDGIVVWSDAELGNAAEAIVECFYGSGQICMVPNYVLAHPAISHELIERVTRLAAEIKPGFPDQDGVLLSPVRRSERFFRLLRQSQDLGGVIVCGGGRIDVDGQPSDTGVFLEPTVVRINGIVEARDHEIVREETFFPLLPIVVPEMSSDQQILDSFIDFVNTNRYGLRNSLWSESEHVIDIFVSRVGNGGLLKVNDSHIGFLPFLPSHGGTGVTGGAFGEANYPMFKTSHLQGISIAHGVNPRHEIFGNQAEPVPAPRAYHK